MAPTPTIARRHRLERFTTNRGPTSVSDALMVASQARTSDKGEFTISLNEGGRLISKHLTRDPMIVSVFNADRNDKELQLRPIHFYQRDDEGIEPTETIREISLDDPTHGDFLAGMQIAVFKAQKTKQQVRISGPLIETPKYFALLVGAGKRSYAPLPEQLQNFQILANRISFRAASALNFRLATTTEREVRELYIELFNEQYLGLLPDGTVIPDFSPPKFDGELHFTIGTKEHQNSKPETTSDNTSETDHPRSPAEGAT